MTADQQRAAADFLQQTCGASQRRAARVLKRSRSTLRYRRRPRAGESAVVKAIRRLARRHLRWGYKRIHARLVHQGWTVNRKRVRRLWQAAGFEVSRLTRLRYGSVRLPADLRPGQSRLMAATEAALL